MDRSPAEPRRGVIRVLERDLTDKPADQERAVPNAPANVEVETGADGDVVLRLSGRLDAAGTAGVWKRAMAAASKKPDRLVVEASGIEYCDGAGFGLLMALDRAQRQNGKAFELKGLAPEFDRLYESFDVEKLENLERTGDERASLTATLGRAASVIWADAVALISFVGELCVTVVRAIRRPGLIRWKEFHDVAETAGVNALPIVVLISFLVGLIMSFQAAIPMKMFGAEIFVADLIALSMVRELGPLMTAIVLAGRSASAFAAEIGTMKVGEEIDALTTMGLDPVAFLVVPRVIAAVLMTPLLTVFANLVGIAGGAFVLLASGYSLTAYVNEALGAIDYVDFVGGLVKSFVFGVLIAGIGCLRGLETGTGASAVGDSTTSAVVSGIVLIVVTDGVFAVLYYYLGL
jgi:phospholipid/cholesterol/gamma-HCH transport system permease protein